MASTERRPALGAPVDQPSRPSVAVARPHRSSNSGIRGFLADASRRLWSGPAHRWLVRAFTALQALGVNVTPNHYYWPIPDVRALGQHPWPQPALTAGMNFDFDSQIQFLQNAWGRYLGECSFSNEPGPLPYAYHYNNGLFETVDAEVAYCMVRCLRPRRVIEIGGGFSTRLMAAALLQNRREGGRLGELITVEPFPDEVLANGFPGMTMLIADPVQKVSLDLFASLGENDVLFIDSSHVVATGSDVCYEILNILPVLQKGVVIQFHDIFLPAEYPERAVLHNLCFWSEQYLLQAFLTFNNEFEVLWASSAMQLFRPDILLAAFPQWRMSYARLPQVEKRFIPTLDFEQVWPSSFWMRRRT